MPSLMQKACGLFALLGVNHVNAFIRLDTQSLVKMRADPIITPGKVSGHVHQVTGGNAFGFTLDYAGTQKSTCTSAQVTEDKSNYWTPILYHTGRDGKFTKVEQIGGVLVYYLQRPEDRPGQPSIKKKAFPEGFRMVAGDPFRRNFTDTFDNQAVSFACLDYNAPARKETNNLPAYACPNGVRAQVFFPSCWDGKNLDSPDHKSHMSYPEKGAYNGGTCPSTHPVQLISIFYEVSFDTNKLEFWGGNYGTNQPFILSQGDPTGYGFHGDFQNGWNVPLLQSVVDTCTDLSGRIEDCHVLDKYVQSNDVKDACKIPTAISEDITGPFDKLPGCNPITKGPGRANPVTDCPTTEISGPIVDFTDVSAKGWSYLGCAADDINSRSLKAYMNVYSTDQATTSVDTCIEKCKGYKYMGLEYGKQCFCDNTIPADRLPSPSTFGACNMPCAGNSSQICGGGSQLNLYQACSGTSCANSSGYKSVGDLVGKAGVGAAPIVSPAPASPSSPAPAVPAVPDAVGNGGPAPKPATTTPAPTKAPGKVVTTTSVKKTTKNRTRTVRVGNKFRSARRH